MIVTNSWSYVACRVKLVSFVTSNLTYLESYNRVLTIYIVEFSNYLGVLGYENHFIFL